MSKKPIKEFNSSFGVDAVVPDPVPVKSPLPPGSQDNAETSSVPQGSSESSRFQIINAIIDALKGLTQQEAEEKIGKILEALEIEDLESYEVKPNLITTKDLSVAEDISAIFTGQELSEDFLNKAKTVYSATVVEQVNKLVESINLQAHANVEVAREEIYEEISEQVNQYLDYAVTEWMEENKLAVENGIKVEVAENVLASLKGIFIENYINIPEEKEDLVDALTNKVEEMQAAVNEQIQANINLKKELNESKKVVAINKATAGLVETQAIKLKSLAEGVEFESEEDFEKKITTIKESYFTKSTKQTLSEEDNFDTGPVVVEGENEVKLDPNMARYVNSISQTVKK